MTRLESAPLVRRLYDPDNGTLDRLLAGTALVHDNLRMGYNDQYTLSDARLLFRVAALALQDGWRGYPDPDDHDTSVLPSMRQ